MTFHPHTDRDREQMLGRRPSDLMTAASAERIATTFLPLLRRDGKLEGERITFVTLSGESVDCLNDAVVEHDPDSGLIRTVALYTELADRSSIDLPGPQGAFERGRCSEPALWPADGVVLTEKQIKELQRKNTLSALKLSNWRVSGKKGAADLLGVKATTLADRMKILGIKRPRR